MSDENRVHIEPAGLGAEERQTSEGSGAFSFDTSGHVNLGKAAFPFHNEYVEWSDLSPFVQGYVEALFASLPVLCTKCEGNGEIVTDWQAYLHPPEGAEPDAGTATCPACDGQERIAYRFDRLDPSALALILRDCEALTTEFGYGRDAGVGGYCWRLRQLAWDSPETLNGPLPDAPALCKRFPPLQPYLSDEGRVCLAHASRSDVTASEGEVSPGKNS